MFRVLEWFSEAVGWLQIVAFPSFIGLVSGALIYSSNPTTTSLVIGICVATLGLAVGVFWATKKWNSKEGTIWFVSRYMATPELDEKEKEIKN